MSIRTHHYAPVTDAGRMHWRNFDPPTAGTDRAPARATAVGANSQSLFAVLEHPVDLAVIVADNVHEPVVAAVLAALPAPLPAAVVLATARSSTADHAAAAMTLPVAAAVSIAEADHEGILVSGHVWVAPDARTLTLERRGNAIHTVLHAPSTEETVATLDALLASAATTFGARTLVIVLSGSTRDGLRGCEVVRAAGGRIIAAADAGTILPTAIAQAGLAHAAWPTTGLPQFAADCIEHGRHDPRRERGGSGDAPPAS